MRACGVCAAAAAAAGATAATSRASSSSSSSVVVLGLGLSSSGSGSGSSSAAAMRQLLLQQQHSRRGSRRRRGGRVVRIEAVLQWRRKPEMVGTAPRVVVVTSGKGGVGKTTVTANVGAAVARLGLGVVALDADVGLRNLDLLLGLENRVNYTAAEVLNGECRLEQALVRDKRWPHLELLCINKPRYKLPLGFGGKALTWLVEALRRRPGGPPAFILIDCPAGIDAGFITAITPADEAVLVTTPDITSLRDADRVTGLLECDGVRDISLIVNRVRGDMIRGDDMMSVLDVQEMLGLPLLGVVPEDAHVIRSTNRGFPLVLSRPPTLAGLALEQAAWRLVEKRPMQAVPIELASSSSSSQSSPHSSDFQQLDEQQQQQKKKGGSSTPAFLRPFLGGG